MSISNSLYFPNPIPLSFIAEYQYCPRSAFYLLTDAPKLRCENDYIQSGRQAHEKVDAGYSGSKSSKKVESSVRVFSEVLGINGKIDILEFYKNNEIIPVELKRGKARENQMHQIQLALTALCLKEMFPEKIIKKAAIFFCEDRKRQEILLTDDLLAVAKNIALEIHQKIQSGLNPKNFPMQKDQRCNGCCFYDVCYI